MQYIGVGKVNAALGVYRFVQEFKPTKIINFGTAGSLKDNLTGLVEATSFYQRDMDARPMGFFLGQTPFEDDICIYLDRPGVSCGSGDSFVTSTPELLTDIVDMEAFALDCMSAHFSLRWRQDAVKPGEPINDTSTP